MKLNNTQKFYINSFFLFASGVYVNKSEEIRIIETDDENTEKLTDKSINKFNKVKKVYYISVPNNFNSHGRSKQLLYGDKLAKLFQEMAKTFGVGSFSLKDNKLVSEIEIKYIIRNEEWDWDRYKNKKESLLKSGKYDSVKEYIEELSKNYEP